MWTVKTFRNIEFRDLERERVAATSLVQSHSAERILILAEPRPTFTGGRTAQESDLVWDAATREERGVVVAPVGRGGQWTYHGPGQIVVYPIASLRHLTGSSRRVEWFLNEFRQAIQRALTAVAVKSVTGDRPYGVYVEGSKLGKSAFLI
ncbi:MAG: hypothetical protein HYR96_13270 [Deltaproteobacteria bacterium]|nr:hypothetical protein [Deltaproteobacteria bacterium]